MKATRSSNVQNVCGTSIELDRELLTNFLSGFEDGIRAQFWLPPQSRLRPLSSAQGVPGRFAMSVTAGGAQIVSQLITQEAPIDEIHRGSRHCFCDGFSKSVERVKERVKRRCISVNKRHSYGVFFLSRWDFHAFCRFVFGASRPQPLFPATPDPPILPQVPGMPQLCRRA